VKADFAVKARAVISSFCVLGLSLFDLIGPKSWAECEEEKRVQSESERVRMRLNVEQATAEVRGVAALSRVKCVE
jgi:hypothetical protein